MENLIKNIEILREQIQKTWRLLDLDRVKEKAEELKVEMNKPDFWDNQNRAVVISKAVEDAEKEVGEWEKLSGEVRELEELVAVAQSEDDYSMEEDLHEKYEELKKKYERFEFAVLFSEKYDGNNAIVSIHAGTGGVDAQDWAEMLERMYLRFSENQGFKASILDRTHGGEAGIKSMTMKIAGRYAYGYLKSESGVHRLVRISPFDAESMRHTSFALVEVIPELEEVEEIAVNEADLRIDTYRSSGPGGQNVNKTDSAIRITHVPTGIVVACQNERSQHQNRETAMRILKSKLHRLEVEKKEAEEKKLRGEAQKAEWGKQIRSYVLQPYKLVKDHRTNYETQEAEKVLDGNLEKFIEEYLRYRKK